MMMPIGRSLALVGLAFAQATAQTPRLSPNSARHALDEYLGRAEAQGISGVFVVLDGDDTLVNRAIGWRDPSYRIPNDTSTLFYIASIAKQFVATAILKLADEGRVRTTDSLAKFFPDAPRDKRSITIDQLLSHTSGLTRYGWDAARRDWKVEDRAAGVKGILATPLASRPGAEFSYQNTNYLLLAEVIERVTHQPFEKYVDERLVRAGGLRETYMGTRVSDALRARVAWSLGDEAESFSILDRTPTWLAHQRGVVMTASDLARWAQAVSRGSILSVAGRRKLFTIGATLGTRYGYGAGWFVRTDSVGNPRVAFHGGDFGSYHAEVRVYPSSGRVFVALTNVSNHGRSLTETLLNQIADVSRGAPDPLPSLSQLGSPATALSGEYRWSKDDAIVASARGSSLVLTPVGARAVDWLVRGDTTGWPDRVDAGRRSLSFIGALNRSALKSLADVAPLADETRAEIETEWAGLTRRSGPLKSYQLLGATPSPDDTGQVVVIRLKFARDSLLFGVGWLGNTFRYTTVGIQNLVAPVVFAKVGGNEWASYDWSSGTVRRVTVSSAPPNGRATLTLHAVRGPVSFERTR
jgi:CubicO group peptidase (beta-lactamase class C family)